MSMDDGAVQKAVGKARPQRAPLPRHGLTSGGRLLKTGQIASDARRRARRLAVLLPVAYFAALFGWGVLDFVGGDPAAVAYQLLTLAYLAALALVYLLPGRGTARAAGTWWEWLAALASANLLIPLSLLPQRDIVPYPALMAALFTANALAWWALLTLRSAFSLTPEARRLVTGGPYRFVRHPLYLSGAIVALALLAATWSVRAVALFLLWAGVTWLRARAEERVLRRAFPEAYEAYARKTPALVPGTRL